MHTNQHVNFAYRGVFMKINKTCILHQEGVSNATKSFVAFVTTKAICSHQRVTNMKNLKYAKHATILSPREDALHANQIDNSNAILAFMPIMRMYEQSCYLLKKCDLRVGLDMVMAHTNGQP